MQVSLILIDLIKKRFEFSEWFTNDLLSQDLKMTIVIVGNGMYVSGRGTKGYGTIMPAISSTFAEVAFLLKKLK